MSAGTATSSAIPRLRRRARAALLTVHIAMSVGWFGLDGALVALEITGLGTGDPTERAGIAAATAAIVTWVLVPVVFSALVSGLVLALYTPWGLMRYWWVRVKCGSATALTATGALLLLPRLHQVVTGEGASVEMQTLVGRSVGLVLLLAATGLSVAKPWGRTPHGRAVRETRKLVQQK